MKYTSIARACVLASLLFIGYLSFAADQAFLSNAFAQSGQSIKRQGVYKNSAQAMREADISQHASLIREFTKGKAIELGREWSETDWLSAAPHYIGQTVPFLRFWRLHNAINGPHVGSIFPGTNLGEQVGHLLRLPYSEAKEKLSAALDDLKSANMIDAIRFTDAVASFTSNDEIVLNASLIVDILILFLIWRLARKYWNYLSIAWNVTKRRVLALASTEPLLLGAVGFGCLITGFFVADGYSPYAGLLGSLSLMSVSLIVLEVPFRWIIVFSLLLMLYSTYRFLRAKSATHQ